MVMVQCTMTFDRQRDRPGLQGGLQ